MILYCISTIVLTVVANFLTDFLKEKGWWI